MAIKKSSNIGFANRSIMYVPPAGGITQTRVGIEATGGTIEDFTIGGITYRSHSFTTSGSFVISGFYGANTDAELVVAAGGGSATNSSGGAGGGVRYYGAETTAMRTKDGTSLTNLAVGSYTVTVGAGSSAGSGSTGGTSSFVGTNYNISATGGEWGDLIGNGTLYSRAGIYVNEYNSYLAGYGGTTGQYGYNSWWPGGGGSWPQNGAPGNSNSGGPLNGGSGCFFRYIKPGGLVVGGGGGGGNAGGYGANIWQYFDPVGGGFSGGKSGYNADANSGGGAGGRGHTDWAPSGALRSGGSGIVVIRYRIY